MTPEERALYGFARVRDAQFDAVRGLWDRRQAEGMQQADLARAIGKDEGWVSRNLRGPGNWTSKTVGAFVEGLNGEIEIKIYAIEDPLPIPPNYHAYAGYETEPALSVPINQSALAPVVAGGYSITAATVPQYIVDMIVTPKST
jgi:hypothetical protein